MLREEGLRAIIAIPVLVQTSEVFGALSVFYRGEREFGDADVELLSAFGTQASVAIENARSFEHLALKAHNDEVLQAVAERFLQATVEREILENAVHATSELIDADSVGVFLFDLAANCLRLEAGSGWRSGTVGSLVITPAEDSLAGYTFLNKQAVQVENLANERRFRIPPHLASHGLHAGIALPLGVREQPVGILAAYYRAPHRFSDEESRALTSLVHQTALALEKVRLHADLQTSLERLKETQAQLIQADKLKALGTLMSGMAHELNNPLSTIRLSLQLMRNEIGLPEPIRRRLDVLDEACERAARIVRELLVFARRKPPERRRVDLNEVARNALTLQMPEFALNNIRIVTDLSPLPAIWADAPQLQQVLLNLFSNARDALKEALGEGVLTVRSREVGEGVMVQVEDNGPGILPENLHRVFDPFFTTKGVGEGTGLGLSLSIGIVEAHGGSLQAETAPGGGSRFTMRLPLGQGIETPQPEEPEPAGPPRRARILVVEDDAPLRSVLAEIFAGLNHAVEEAGTGRAAQDRLEHNTYDLVTLDLKLPDIDGKVVWRWICERKPELASRVIFMTGDTMTPETQDFLHQAGRPVLSKPLVIRDIARAVDALLSASPAPPSA
jgi:signal transduction histidine kinase/ActR/RegA family two-component response regulator